MAGSAKKTEEQTNKDHKNVPACHKKTLMGNEITKKRTEKELKA